MDALLVWAVGFAMLLVGELWAAFDDKPGNTISEVIWWLIGRGRPITPWYLGSRIVVLGSLTWLILHFGTGIV